jgi:hypothetical protein
MKFPNKLSSYKESTLYLIPIILGELLSCDMTPIVLFELIKSKVSLTEYIEALDCLYALGKIDFDQQSEVLHYVA